MIHRFAMSVSIEPPHSWTTSGFASLFIVFEGDSSKSYEVVWNGLKVRDFGGIPTYETFEERGISGDNLGVAYHNFWWDPLDPWNNYGCTIYEGSYSYGSGGQIIWTRGKWVGSVDFYAYQEAAYVSIDNRSSALDFGLSSYYCTVDYDYDMPFLLHGYSEGYWEGPFPGGTYRYHGDPGSPRFHYRESCSVTIPPPARTSRNTRRPTPYRRW